ncbi:MAG: HlyD family secretion protein [Deltaproteobacteria bacterium]
MIRRTVSLVLLAALGIGAYVAYRAYERHLAEEPIEWSGTVEARTSDVGSRVGGRVKAVLVREGDRVKTGQPLLLLEAGDLEAQRLEAEGQQEQIEANLEKLAGHGRNARVQEIAAARARLSAAQIALEKATLDLGRTRRLSQGGAATRSDLDNADIALRNAVAQRDAEQAQLDELLRGTPDDVKAAQGQLDAARGRLAQIQSLEDELTVRAPADSEVEALDLRPGDLLAPNAIAAKLLEPDQLFVRIYVPETQLGRIRLGQTLPVVVDSFPGRTFDGRVEFVAAEGEFTPRNLQTADERADEVFAARLRLESGRGVLRAGMAAFARVAR